MPTTHYLTGTPGSGFSPTWETKPSPSGGVSQTNVIYLSKAGNDSNDGLNVNTPKLTIESALTAAGLLGSGTIIKIMDSGTYTASSDLISIPSGCKLDGRGATIVGYLGMTAGSSVDVYAHYASTNSAPMINPSGVCYYTTRITDSRGTGGSLTGVTIVSSGSSGAIIHVSIDIAYVCASGYFCKDSGLATNGHVHFRCGDIYLAGNSASGIYLEHDDANVVGYVDHILEIGSPTSTVGIFIDASLAKVRIVAGEIVCDTVYNIASGLLYLISSNVVGTRTGTPVFHLSQEAGIAFLGADNTFTEDNDFSGATSLKIPFSATPTVDQNGKIAIDSTVTNLSHGIIRMYSGEELALIPVPVAQLSSLSDGYGFFYNATNDEFEIKAPPTGSITSSTAALSSDVELTTSDTWYDGPSLSLDAGTWLVITNMLGIRTTTTATRFYSRITDKSTHYASGFNIGLSSSLQGGTTSLNAIITLGSTTSIFLQGAASTGGANSIMKAAVPNLGSGNNATRITAIKLA